MGKHDRHESGSVRRSTECEGIRSLRLEQLIKEEINFLLGSEVQDPELDGVSITAVELARDGSRARLWFRTGSAVEDDEATGLALQRAAGFFRARLCDALGVKRVPELRVRRDPAPPSGREDD